MTYFKRLILMTFIALELFIGYVYADDNIANGDSGVLYVGGELTHGACNIETSSRWQTLAMGTINSGELSRPGVKAHGKSFHLRLRDCVTNSTEDEKITTSNSLGIMDEPVVRISFVSKLDEDNSKLIAVSGAKGFGLLLEDAAHHPVQLNQIGEPMVIDGNSDELIFWLFAQRTVAPLHEGAWHSVVNMRLSYE
ncbi:fimbrial protein [Pantoea sp. OXWO6B1]|uniref:fimbrial protein n=1 Tax=Pantoea sp. OXWO6B1 TaxID=1835724 RepID=UPI0007C781C6|nr:fimbrial protein [Pantoea sp. OXWO6B1]OAD98029.1 hypothetical protein A6A26_24095 [Pantoea sp. OXWO6B1]